MSAFYKISFGTGTAFLDSRVIRVDDRTTNYCALTDMLIDALVEEKHGNILDMDEEYEWDEKGETIFKTDAPDWVIYPDTFIIGGNCGNVFMHYGELHFEDVTAEIREKYGDIIFS